MKPRHITFLAMALAVAGSAAIAQSSPSQAPSATQHEPMQAGHPPGMHPMAGMAGHEKMGMMPHAPGYQSMGAMQSGQAAFGAIQQIVGLLETDPQTDWSKVDVDALRQHLIDMDEVTMRAVARKEPIDKGIRIQVIGAGRTLEAIQRMVPAHAREIDGLNGWTVRAAMIPEGVELTVTGVNDADAKRIRGLGFLGIMVQGNHHPMHHIAMARGKMIGEMIHVH